MEMVPPLCRESQRAPFLLRWRDGGSGDAPVMLGASRHDRRCESDDHGAGQPAASATEGLPNLILASRQNWWSTSGRVLCEVPGVQALLGP